MVPIGNAKARSADTPNAVIQAQVLPARTPHADNPNIIEIEAGTKIDNKAIESRRQPMKHITIARNEATPAMHAYTIKGRIAQSKSLSLANGAFIWNSNVEVTGEALWAACGAGMFVV